MMSIIYLKGNLLRAVETLRSAGIRVEDNDEDRGAILVAPDRLVEAKRELEDNLIFVSAYKA